MARDETAPAEAFDRETWLERLYAANPWLRENGLELPEPEDFSLEHGHSTGEEFVKARRRHCFGRYVGGAEAWNRWADAMAALSQELEAASRFQSDMRSGPVAERYISLPQAQNAETAALLAVILADFAGVQFDQPADFSEFRFPGAADFGSAAFLGAADFRSASFLDLADFRSAAFSGAAGFRSAAFSGEAGFRSAAFSSTADFRSAAFSGAADFRSTAFSDRADFAIAAFSGAADFESATFSERADFGAVTFSRSAVFQSAMFSERALFHSAAFSDLADFWSAAFSDAADFGSAAFADVAVFWSATFSDQADFQSAAFSDQAVFTQAQFSGFASFAGASFKQAAVFTAVQGREGSAFTLENAVFHQIPDFIQAHFQEAPRLDNVRVSQNGDALSFWRAPLTWLRGLVTVNKDPDLSARWRNLKRLAIQAHDHERELDFFAGEVLSQRWVSDKPLPWFWKDRDGRRRLSWPNGERFWFGVLYQLFSNFGRSILRPLAVWVLLILAFAVIDLDAHFDVQQQAGAAGYPAGVIEWGAAGAPALDCVAGEGTPWSAALYVSASKAMVLTAFSNSAGQQYAEACLYGTHPAAKDGELPEQFMPVVPESVLWWTAPQLLLSTALIVLFLMAIRNHFRIS